VDPLRSFTNALCTGMPLSCSPFFFLNGGNFSTFPEELQILVNSALLSKGLTCFRFSVLSPFRGDFRGFWRTHVKPSPTPTLIPFLYRFFLSAASPLIRESPERSYSRLPQSCLEGCLSLFTRILFPCAIFSLLACGLIS